MKLIIATHNFYKQIYKVGDSHFADAFIRMGHNVLYLSGPLNLFRLRHVLNRDPVGIEYRQAFKAWMRGGFFHNDSLLEFHPLSLLPISRRVPFGSSDLALSRNMTLTLPYVYRYIEKNGFAHPDILLVSQLQMAELLDKVDAKVNVLRLTDDISSFRHLPDKIRMLEKKAVERADIVVVTSVVLRERLSSIRRDVVYIPNAVDLEFYHAADRSIPPEYRRLKGPIVVYIGAIDYWFNTDLVAFLATYYPKVNFVIIGVPRISLASLEDFKNVHLLGARPYSKLPRYLWNASVGFIPFKKLPLVESVNPLKLWEYMACGLPVVSTRWQELARLGSPAFLADTLEEFAEKLSEALEAAHDTSFKKRCMNFAANNTWDKRAQQILRLVHGLKDGKHAPSSD